MSKYENPSRKRRNPARDHKLFIIIFLTTQIIVALTILQSERDLCGHLLVGTFN